MVAYRRNFVPGGSYFFTVTLLDRSSSLLTDRIDDLRSVRAERPFSVDAIVVLPDHLHCIWTLPPGDADFSLRWREIKQVAWVEPAKPGGINALNSRVSLRSTQATS